MKPITIKERKSIKKHKTKNWKTRKQERKQKENSEALSKEALAKHVEQCRISQSQLSARVINPGSRAEHLVRLATRTTNNDTSGSTNSCSQIPFQHKRA